MERMVFFDFVKIQQFSRIIKCYGEVEFRSWPDDRKEKSIPTRNIVGLLQQPGTYYSGVR